MKLTDTHRRLLEEGLNRATTPKQKWQVVLMIIAPFLIGNKLFQDTISGFDQKPIKNEKTVKEIVLCENEMILATERFWREYQFLNSSLCNISALRFNYYDQEPILTENRLILGWAVGFGPEPWYLDLTK